MSKGDEHRLARQKVISAWLAWEFQISGKKIVSEGDEHRLARQNVIFFISESRNYQVGTKIGPQKCPHMFFLIVGYLYSLINTIIVISPKSSNEEIMIRNRDIRK